MVQLQAIPRLEVKNGLRRAVFLDRDGVLNELVCDPDHGRIDSPLHVSQLRVWPKAGQAVKLLNRLGFVVVVVSNQPAVAKGKMWQTQLEAITRRLVRQIKRSGGGRIEDVLYCLHHPLARSAMYRKRCQCRKPEPGLLLQAARRWKIALGASYMVGDGMADIQAGRRAGCRTIWIGDWRCEFCRASHHAVHPDHIASDVWAAARLIQQLESKGVVARRDMSTTVSSLYGLQSRRSRTMSRSLSAFEQTA